jgi:hypothetical protein
VGLGAGAKKSLDDPPGFRKAGVSGNASSTMNAAVSAGTLIVRPIQMRLRAYRAMRTMRRTPLAQIFNQKK